MAALLLSALIINYLPRPKVQLLSFGPRATPFAPLVIDQLIKGSSYDLLYLHPACTAPGPHCSRLGRDKKLKSTLFGICHGTKGRNA